MSVKKILEIEIKGLDKELEQLGKLEQEITRLRTANKQLKKSDADVGKEIAANNLRIKELADQKRRLEKTTLAQVRLGQKEAKTLAQVSEQLKIERERIRQLAVGSKEFNIVAKRIKELEKKQRDYNQAIGRGRTFVGEYAKGFTTAFVKVGAAVGAAMLAFRTLSSAVSESIKLYDTQIKAEKSLEVALGHTSQALLSQASALQKLTRYGDEQIIQADAYLAQMGLEEEQIKRIIPHILDLAAAKGMDLRQAADLVAKSIGSSTNALSRYGIEIKGAAGSSERLQSAIDALNEKFHGQAKALAEVGLGPLQQLSNAWGDLKEKLGGLLAKGLAPVIKGLTGFISKLGDNKTALDKNIESIEKERAGLNSLIGAITDNNTSTEERKRLLVELNKKYPAFLKNLDIEKVTNGQLRDRLRDANIEYQNRIKLLIREELLQRHKNALATKWQELLNAETERESLRAKLGAYERLNAIISKMKKTTPEISDILRKYHKDDLRLLGLEGEKSMSLAILVRNVGYDLRESYKKNTEKIKQYRGEIEKVNKVLDYQTKKFDEQNKIVKEGTHYTEAETKAVRENTEAKIQGNEKVVAISSKQVDKLKETRVEIDKIDAGLRNVTKATADQMATTYEKRMQIISETIKQLGEVAMNEASNIIGAYTDGQMTMFQNAQAKEMDMLNERMNREQEALNMKLQNGVITQEQYNAKMLELEQQKKRKEEQLKRKEFEEKKKLDIENVLMNGAVAIIKTLANLGLPQATPFMVAAGVETAVQAALIASRKYPKFAGGGIVPNGYEINNDYDNTLILAHPGEVVLTKEQQAMLGGAEVFKNIGVPGFADGGVVPPTRPLLNAEDIASAIRMVKVVNVATETTEIASKVYNIETEYEI